MNESPNLLQIYVWKKSYPDLEHLKYMHMTEKDLIAPVSWNTSQSLVDYTILDEGQEEQLCW